MKCGGGIPAKYIMTIEDYCKKLLDNKKSFDLLALKNDKKNELKRFFYGIDSAKNMNLA